MKLSKLTTEQAADVLCELTPYISNLTGDKALLDTLKEKIGNGNRSVAEIYTYGAKKISTIIPILLKEHRSDVFGILSILNGKSVEEISKQNVLNTIEQIKDAVQDKELVDFFKSWQQEGSE